MKDNRETIGLIIFWAALCIGVFLRMGYLTQFPAGIHGDEAWTGLRGGDILKTGWIGVWDSVHSIGQPAGSSYTNAVATAILGTSIWSMRFASALAAVIALCCFAVFARITLHQTLAAAVAVLFYALADQEILLGRVGFPPIWGQAVLMAALAQIAVAAQSGARWPGIRIICAGATLGLTVYFYPTPIAVAPALVLGLPFWLRNSGTLPVARSTWHFIFGLGLAMLPMMVAFVFGIEEMPRSVLFLPPDLATYLRDFWTLTGNLFVSQSFDGIDGTGVNAAFPISLSVPALAGVVMLVRRKDHLWPLGLLLVGVFVSALAFAAIFYYDGSGLYRRAMAALIPLVWFAGYALRGRGVVVVAVLLVFAVAESGLRIDRLIRSENIRWVYCEATTRTIEAIARLKQPEATVYFASARHSWNYEIRRYLLPDQQGEDISEQFSSQSTPLLADVRPGSIVALAEGYLQWVPEFRTKYAIAQEISVIGAGGSEIGHVFRLEP